MPSQPSAPTCAPPSLLSDPGAPPPIQAPSPVPVQNVFPRASLVSADVTNYVAGSSSLIAVRFGTQGTYPVCLQRVVHHRQLPGIFGC